MASLIQITRAVKSYGDQVLLDGAEAALSDNVKVGFIGRNGAGKSTLLRILLGEEELGSGIGVRDRGHAGFSCGVRYRGHAEVSGSCRVLFRGIGVMQEWH